MRQKQVFTRYDDLVRAWVEQKQPSGRTPSARLMGSSERRFRLTFEGDTLYSYGHFPIARIVSLGVAFITTRYWSTTVLKSPTTEGHKRCAKHFLSIYNYQIFRVDDVTAYDQTGNVQDLQANAVKAINRCFTARSNFPYYLRSAYYEIDKAKALALAFGLPYDRRWLVEPLGKMTRKKVKAFKQILINKTKERMHINGN